MTESTCTHALMCADRGWRIFPLAPGTKIPVPGCHWPEEATRDPVVIARWWETSTHPNYGVVTGQISGIFVVDIDRHGQDDAESGVADGLVSLGLLEAEHGEVPPTLTVRTPSGGVHLYFQYPEGGVANSVGKIGLSIDVRGDGGYVVGPGSVVGSVPYAIIDRWRG